MKGMRWISLGTIRTERVWVRATAMMLLVVFTFSACYTWRPVTQPVPELIREKPQAVLRIARDDGRSTTVHSVRVTGDSLSGRSEVLSREWCLTIYGCPLTFIIRRSVTMPLEEVRAAEVRKTQRGRTAALVGTIFAVTAAAVWVNIACRDESRSPGANIGPC